MNQKESDEFYSANAYRNIRTYLRTCFIDQFRSSVLRMSQQGDIEKNICLNKSPYGDLIQAFVFLTGARYLTTKFLTEVFIAPFAILDRKNPPTLVASEN